MGPLTELPRELVVGWALWVVGGALLITWFWRRSAAARPREVAPPLPHGGVAKLSGTHTAAGRSPSSAQAGTGRNLSGSHSTAGRSSSATRAAAPKTASAAHPPDAFAELRALLDQPEDPPRAG